MGTKITATSYALPQNLISSAQVEEKLRKKNPHLTIPQNIIERVTGVTHRYFSGKNEFNSTLAAKAAENLFTNFGIKREEIDLLIFASAGQDLIEPATSHIIQNLLQTNARVFDIKNACNAFIDALSIGHNFIQNNEHQRILIVSGEASSKAIKWRLTDKQDFKNSFAGYTFGDLGTAILLEKDPYPNHSMTFTYFSDSSVWSSGTLPGGGSRHPHDEAYTYFQGNAAGLDTVFRNSFPSFYTSFLKKNNLNVEDIKHVCMHQVTRSYTEEMVKYLNINPNNLQTTISTYGNVAACTLPLQLNLFRQEHTFNHGDITLLIGLAGGMSITLGLLRW